MSGPAGNSGTTDDRIPNAGIILIKPPAQRRMGGKRRLVDQGLRFNARVIAAPARFSCGMTLDICGHRHREIRPVTDLDARLPMHGARNLNPAITLKNLLRRTYCPQAGGRCSVTGRLWPTGEELVKPARMTGELHRQPLFRI